MKQNLRKAVLVLCAVLCILCGAIVLGGTQNAGSPALRAQAYYSSVVTNYVTKGQTITLKVSGGNNGVRWSSDDPKIATVNSKGVVTGIKKGETVIRATRGNSTARCYLTVEVPKISKKSITMVKGDTRSLEMKGTCQQVKWSSSNKKIVTVDSYGYVRAVRKGEAVITAKVGGLKYTCNVKVETPKLSKTEITLVEGKTFRLKLLGNTQKVKWSSNNADVATVNKKGVVKAVSSGYTSITATINGDYYTCRVTVERPPVDLSKIQETYYDTGAGIVAVLRNDTPDCLEVKTTAVYYDANGKILDTSYASLYKFKSGATVALAIYGPRSSTYERLPYSSYEIKLTADYSYYKNEELANEKIRIESSYTSDQVIVTATNTGKTDLSGVQIAIAFFDANGKCIGYNYDYADCKRAGSKGYVDFRFPYDSDYNTIIPASYQVFVNYAY